MKSIIRLALPARRRRPAARPTSALSRRGRLSRRRFRLSRRGRWVRRRLRSSVRRFVGRRRRLVRFLARLKSRIRGVRGLVKRRWFSASRRFQPCRQLRRRMSFFRFGRRSVRSSAGARARRRSPSVRRAIRAWRRYLIFTRRFHLSRNKGSKSKKYLSRQLKLFVKRRVALKRSGSFGVRPKKFFGGFRWPKAPRFLRRQLRRQLKTQFVLYRLQRKVESRLQTKRRVRTLGRLVRVRLILREMARRRAQIRAKLPRRVFVGKTPFIRIRKTLHNLFFGVFNEKSQLLYSSSLYAMAPKLEKDKYSRASIAAIAGRLALHYAKLRHRTIDIQLYSPLSSKISGFIRALRQRKLYVKRIFDRVHTPHNGLRAKKHRNQRR